MAHHSNAAKEPLRQLEPGHELNHQASTVSALSDDDINPYDDRPQRQPLHGRESLLSIDSRVDQFEHHGNDDDGTHDKTAAGPASPIYAGLTTGWKGSFPYTGASGSAYTPVEPASNDMPSFSARAALSRMGRKVSRRRHRPTQAAIHEEEYDLSLLQGAAPMDGARGNMVYGIEEEDEEDEDDSEDEGDAGLHGFDVTAALGPTTMETHDMELQRKLRQQQEASGHLTGGLGLGFRADSTLRDSDVLQSPTALSRGLSRRLTGLARRRTIRDIGQEEANRRGEVIEVIHEDTDSDSASVNGREGTRRTARGPTTESVTDLSTLGGPDHILGPGGDDSGSMASSPRKKPTLTRSRTEMFYPQPNWKPLSMRWPYLAVLVALSAGLAGMQEVLFRRFQGRDKPLVQFREADEVPAGLYFVVKFGPTIAAVCFGVLWQFTDFSVRRFEAYYQMSRPGGALASRSINVDYVTSFSFFRPVHALRARHHAVALSSLASTLAASLVPTFAAASLMLTPSREERADHPEDPKEIRYSSAFSRLLTSTLCVCAACGLALLVLLQKRRSGLKADVRGISGLASMAVVSHILMDFRDLDTATPDDVHHRLGSRRYLLRNSCLAPADDNPPASTWDVRNGGRRGSGSNDDDADIRGTGTGGSNLPGNPHPVMLRPAGFLPFMAGLMAYMLLIPILLFTKADVVTDKAPWAVTALAVGLKLAWGGLETAVRMMEPYYLLSRRHAPAKTLSLDYTALPFGYMPIRALFNGHLLVFLVGFGTVMTEFLTILVTGLASVDGRNFLMRRPGPPNKGHGDDDDGREAAEKIIGSSGQETVLSFYLSLALALFILLYMMTVTGVVFWRRRHPFLPRQPNTIASVLAFIHQSKMLYRFVGVKKTTTTMAALRRASAWNPAPSPEDIQRQLDHQSSTYGLGWFIGRDGQPHCGVDQEELMGSYKHGVDGSKGVQQGPEQWDVW